MGQDFTKIKRYGKYKSGLEYACAKEMEAKGVPFKYEPKDDIITYVVPEKVCWFTPNFVLPNGICLHTVGYMTAADRQKYRLVRDSGLDLRLILVNANTRISKKSSTTYGMWAKRYGIPFAEQTYPKAWLKESGTPASLAAVAAMKPNPRKPRIAV
jgi:hypothetical protein